MNKEAIKRFSECKSYFDEHRGSAESRDKLNALFDEMCLMLHVNIAEIEAAIMKAPEEFTLTESGKIRHCESYMGKILSIEYYTHGSLLVRGEHLSDSISLIWNRGGGNNWEALRTLLLERDRCQA